MARLSNRSPARILVFSAPAPDPRREERWSGRRALRRELREWKRATLSSPDGSDDVAVLLLHGADGPAASVARPRSTTLAGACDLAGDPSVRAVAVIRAREAMKVVKALGRVVHEVDGASRFLVLLARRHAPPEQRRGYRPIGNFACDSGTFRRACTDASTAGELTFTATVTALEDPEPSFVVLVRQLPLRVPATSETAGATPRIRVVIPHRGELALLDHCLRRTSFAHRAMSGRIHVGLDQAPDARDAALIQSFPEARFWRVTPPRSGPYVVRHALGTDSDEPLLAWQDSDDIPCSDRFTRLASAMEAHDLAVVGSHMILVDDQSREVIPRRCPVDDLALSAERPRMVHFPTTLLIRRDAFVRAGGFSTVRRFASDREFCLRVLLLKLPMQNVDDFLYLRRRRATSLTQVAETGMNSAVRLELHDAWHADYFRVARGELDLADSSLAPTYLETSPTFEALS